VSARVAATTATGRPARRAYDNTLRRQQAAATRRRIVLAGSQLLHESHVRDWAAVTIRAVAERAGVNERTVYRHFDNERGVRDAVMHQLEQEAGIELDGMGLDDVRELATRIFRHVSSFRSAPRAQLDPTMTEAMGRVHAALLQAVGDDAPTWSEEDRTMAAAILDLLSSVGAYERLVGDWALAPAQATAAVVWVIGLVEDAVRGALRPTATRSRSQHAPRLGPFGPLVVDGGYSAP
jgi:AcrR family transcriptional regulator